MARQTAPALSGAGGGVTKPSAPRATHLTHGGGLGSLARVRKPSLAGEVVARRVHPQQLARRREEDEVVVLLRARVRVRVRVRARVRARVR
eukprot:scaffold57017_cov39-Phaeocystis_antarctica.AAC.1